MLTVLAAIFVFGILITVHEFGHFIVAKMTGMKVEEFAIGFGPCIYQTKDGDTEYSLRLIPLGGYNKIAGMDPEDEPCENGFNSKSIPARMAVILAGVFMNFLLPIILFTGIYMVEGQDKIDNAPVLGKVVEFSAAERAGLKVGDKILTINDKVITDWRNVVNTLRDNGEKEVSLKIERDGKEQSFSMLPKYDEEGYKKLHNAITSFVKQTNDSNVRIGLESTGHYSNNILLYFVKLNYKVMLINPLLTNMDRKATTVRKTKTDKVDARGICMFLDRNKNDFKSYTLISYHNIFSL